MQRFLAGRTVGFAISVVTVAAIAFLYRHVIHVNQTTVALTLLLAILAVSAVWGVVVSVFISVVGMLVFKDGLLPPVGTFTIAAPRTWGAPGPFLLPSPLGIQPAALIPEATD